MPHYCDDWPKSKADRCWRVVVGYERETSYSKAVKDSAAAETIKGQPTIHGLPSNIETISLSCLTR